MQIKDILISNLESMVQTKEWGNWSWCRWKDWNAKQYSKIESWSYQGTDYKRQEMIKHFYL